MVKHRRLYAVLIVSLAVNLLVIGAVGGRWLRGGHDRPPPLVWAGEELRPDARERLRPVLQQSAQETRKLREQIREASDAVRVVIGADPLDRDALSKALANLRAVTQDYQAEVHETAINALTELDVEDRERFAARLLRPGPAPGGRLDGRRPPPPPGHRPLP